MPKPFTWVRPSPARIVFSKSSVSEDELEAASLLDRLPLYLFPLTIGAE